MPFKASRAILFELFSNKDPKLAKMLVVQWAVACVQALRGTSGGGEGKGRRAYSYVSGIWISTSQKLVWNADWWRWHYSSNVITLGTCFSVFVVICTCFHFVLIGWNLTAQLMGSHREIILEVEFKLQRRSCRLSFLFLPPFQNALESLLTG